MTSSRLAARAPSRRVWCSISSIAGRRSTNLREQHGKPVRRSSRCQFSLGIAVADNGNSLFNRDHVRASDGALDSRAGLARPGGGAFISFATRPGRLRRSRSRRRPVPGHRDLTPSDDGCTLEPVIGDTTFLTGERPDVAVMNRPKDRCGRRVRATWRPLGWGRRVSAAKLPAGVCVPAVVDDPQRSLASTDSSPTSSRSADALSLPRRGYEPAGPLLFKTGHQPTDRLVGQAFTRNDNPRGPTSG